MIVVWRMGRERAKEELGGYCHTQVIESSYNLDVFGR